jgi:adenylylsulfate kinase
MYATLIFIARLLTHNGVNVVIDATGNLRSYRDSARRTVPQFVEVYLSCPLEVCIDRETERKITHDAPSQIYTRAIEGTAPTVPGIGQPYEPPLKPEITLDTAHCEPRECAQKILDVMNAFL